MHEKTSGAQGTFFEVPAKHKCQKPILFGRFESKPITHEISEDNDESQKFSHSGLSAYRMIEKMGYNFTNRSGLNFSKGRKIVL